LLSFFAALGLINLFGATDIHIRSLICQIRLGYVRLL
jgi:hypothetical protein